VPEEGGKEASGVSAHARHAPRGARHTCGGAFCILLKGTLRKDGAVLSQAYARLRPVWVQRCATQTTVHCDTRDQGPFRPGHGRHGQNGTTTGSKEQQNPQKHTACRTIASPKNDAEPAARSALASMTRQQLLLSLIAGAAALRSPVPAWEGRGAGVGCRHTLLLLSPSAMQIGLFPGLSDGRLRARKSASRAREGGWGGEEEGTLVGSASVSRRASRRSPGDDEGWEEEAQVVDSSLQLFLVAAVAAALGAFVFSGGDLAALPAVSLRDGLAGLE